MVDRSYLLNALRMPGKRQLSDLQLKSIWDESLVEQVVKNYRHRNKMWNWLIQHPDKDILDMPLRNWNIPKDACAILQQDFVKFTSTVAEKKESARGDTTKLLVRLQDGHEIETVVIRHLHHATVCVSSQIGCQMACRFCATGTMGIIGDLTAGEILEQLAHANSITKIRNIVFMGMGEPLQNYDNVKSAVLFMLNDQRYGLSHRQVTVSTVGVVKNMRRLTDDIPHVNLALSLHAPNQEIRQKIVPTSSAHKIDKLMEAIDYHISKSKNYSSSEKFLKETCSLDNAITCRFTKRHKLCCVMIEYILIRGVNDRPEHAHELGALLLPRRDFIILNLIPYNPTDIAEDYHPPSKEDVDVFSKICQSNQYEIYTRVRQEMGQDIDGACGQLAVTSKNKLRKKNGGGIDGAIKDIEDIDNPKVKVSKTKTEVNKQKSVIFGLDDNSGRRAYLVAAHLALAALAWVLSVAKRK